MLAAEVVRGVQDVSRVYCSTSHFVQFSVAKISEPREGRDRGIMLYRKDQPRCDAKELLTSDDQATPNTEDLGNVEEGGFDGWAKVTAPEPM